MEEFWKFVTRDWYFAIPMFCMSLSAITMVIWRIMLNQGANTNMSELLPTLQDKLQKEGVEGALRLCREQSGMIPRRLFVAGLETSRQGIAAMRRAMANVIELEILPELNFLLPVILAIAKIATMVGLLGTVISMIGTFSEIERLSREGSKEGITGQSGAIGLALFATALGLVTAIPLVFAHVLFKAWIASFDVRMKSAAQKLMLLVQAQKPASATAATVKIGSQSSSDVMAAKR
ncbi:MAG: MotA/TolQ/ExbB proton channel family protein [Planctomycetes bacterium]|nr:MotA/TolQ/ExbB proton channel family protein [Planctomycetota bacterium]